MIRTEKFFVHTDELKSAKRKSDKSGTSSSFLTQRTTRAAIQEKRIKELENNQK